ncbi:AAA family ATPase [Permianibacter aggregans]|uniref:PIF1-like helicase n=1 Tax=Permianibacter aggregans TaxID=1510150 RepID=A0A4R6UV10_9GAMM|nr:AAA family ATPase [Permianibacter aggregans]QGX39490.1 hypothetical protein E2H98_07395 [Permianibacter aggregans]TDQ49769.1 PIF1-like helicase [Permianibacter aggregans]
MRQSDALTLLRLGYNTFLTGAAGSGKTFLLNRYITMLREHGVTVAVTASTGIAATHLGGQTIHAWSGIGVQRTLDEKAFEKLTKNRVIRRHVTEAQVLVIDEISMLHAFQLDLVDQVLRRLRDNEAPFGGIQLIACGDFFQLPPVTGAEDPASERQFAFEAQSWQRADFNIAYLTENHRQGNDSLLTVLNDIRSGHAGEHTKVPLRTRYKKPPVGVGAVQPTRLYARNINVDSINEKELAALPGKTVEFVMETRGFAALVEGLKRNCLAPETLRLKIGAEVMFVKNAPDGSFVNGSRGRVLGFDAETGWPEVQLLEGQRLLAEPMEWRLEEEGVIRAALKQLPLRLAWAITIHKSQGMTLDAVELDLSDAFEPGMGYVALSRVRTLGGLTLLGLNEIALRVHPAILARDGQFRRLSQQAVSELTRLSEEEQRRRMDAALFERFKGLPAEGLGAGKSRRQRKAKTKAVATHELTRCLLERKLSLAEIANERGLTVGTVLSHMEKLKGQGALPDLLHLRDDIDEFDAILCAWSTSEDGRLGPIHQRFGGRHSFETLKLVRLFLP